jgi:hypothetical protein
MAGDGQPIERLRAYLRELKPEVRALLTAELERAMLRGDDMPGAEMILTELRADLRESGTSAPRPGSPQRMFFAPLDPFLVDDTPDRKHKGRISRSCIEPIWEWLCRDLVPVEVKTFLDQTKRNISLNQVKMAEQVTRAFTDRVVIRLEEVLGDAANNDKSRRRLLGQVRTPHAVEDLREVYAILKGRDALGVIASRLPAQIANLADEQLENIRALLESPMARHRDVYLYALVLVMSRLAAPWQLVRLAIKAADSDVVSKIAATPYAVAVDMVLMDVDRLMVQLRVEARRAGGNVAPLLKDIHDAARTLRTEMDLSGDSPWARQLAAVRSEVSELLKSALDGVPGQVRRLLRVRPVKEIAPNSKLNPDDVADAEAGIELVSVCRNYAGELALSEATLRAWSELQNFLDTGTTALVDGLRSAGAADRSFRQSQIDAAVRFCAKVFGPEYAALISKAADVAAKGEQKKAEAKVASK